MSAYLIDTCIPPLSATVRQGLKRPAHAPAVLKYTEKGVHMLIRRAGKKDIPQIMNLLKQVCLVHHKGRPDLFKNGAGKYTERQLAEIVEDDSRPVFVAADGADEVLGYVFCIFEQHRESNILTDIKTLYIDDLCVDENLRGQRIGRRLYEYAEGFAKRSGCYNLTLNVWSCNASAMKFYESCGLVPQKVHLEMILD